jgi:hypothetical protein
LTRIGSVFEARTFLSLLAATLTVAAGAGEPLRDPTRPHRAEQAAGVVKAQGFRVSAIFVSDARRIAILNGHAVAVGDQVDGATVTAIGERTVRLVYRGSAISAKLNTARIRQ